MKIRIMAMGLLLGTSLRLSAQQVTGLSGWNIFLDPGHSQKENPGIYGLSEAEKNLRVALYLRDLLVQNTDIDTVVLCRYTDTENVTLTARTNHANSLGMAWYHSIHSDAGDATYTSTLLMYGGWRENGQTVEKNPKGGKVMADYMVDLLTRGMRATTRGNYADRTFYQGFPDNHEYKYPYLHVNRETVMASELAEAGFHTNAVQNQLNMNAEFKLLQAYTYYWSILKYHHITIPPIGICTGIVYDIETGVPINGATLRLNGETYTTDTYATLFNKYSTDPEQLHNGFYFFDDLPNDTLRLNVNAPNYVGDSADVIIRPDFFTFRDFNLISTVPPYLVSTTPVDGDTAFIVGTKITLNFSRPMDRASVEANFSLVPAEPGVFKWSTDSRQLTFTTDSLDNMTNYRLTVGGLATGKYGHLFDGNHDGVGGDSLVITFRTSRDVTAPKVASVYPAQTATNIELRPLVTIIYNELLADTSVHPGSVILKHFNTQTIVPGQLVHYTVGTKSVLTFFPSENLRANETHTISIPAGLTDIFGNRINTAASYSFKTGTTDYQVRTIDNFETGLTSNWWTPQTSGSTIGILPATSRAENTAYLNLSVNSTKSLALNYAWDTGAGAWLIREYLTGGAPRDVTFDNTYLLQVYVFGDGSGNQFRFAVDDAAGHEVSPWYTINWIGWKLITWDMANDGCGTWIGDGTLTNPLRIDSFQLTYIPGATATGTIYFDDLRLAKKVSVGIKPEKPLLAEHPQLLPNYPNPFNPTTTLPFYLPERTRVTLSIFNVLGEEIRQLLNEEREGGYHAVEFDASLLPTGAYFYTLKAGTSVLTRKMVLVK